MPWLILLPLTVLLPRSFFPILLVAQGFTEAARAQMTKICHPGDANAKLTVPQEAMSGVIGGALSCWNHPFEVSFSLNQVPSLS
jgi:hypothetical protein